MEIELNKKERGIKGWLAFFVYIWVGLGSVFSFFFMLITLIRFRADMDVSILLLFYEVIPLIVAIVTVRSFVLEKNNAVSLARTFLVLCAFKAFIVFVLCGIAKVNNWFYIYFFGIYVQCVIWLIYLNHSKQVEYVIPLETRTWKLFEKILLSIYALLVLVFMLMCYVYVTMKVQIVAMDNSVEQVTDTIIGPSILVCEIVDSTFVYSELYKDSLVAIKKENYIDDVKKILENDTLISNFLDKENEIYFRFVDVNGTEIYSLNVIQKDSVNSNN